MCDFGFGGGEQSQIAAIKLGLFNSFRCCKPQDRCLPRSPLDRSAMEPAAFQGQNSEMAYEKVSLNNH